MPAVNLLLGKQLLPGLNDVSDILLGNSISTEPKTEIDSMGLAKKAGILADSNLKEIGVGRIVRKTSERQARWVIGTSVSSWQAANISCQPDRVGLFLGLGTVDCEDDDTPLSITPTLTAYASDAIQNTKPLAGLTLLNSTAASHISNILGITGINVVFSPSADAGAQAFIEAFYGLNEQRCDYALVAGGGQKITPWYFLSYRKFFEQAKEYDAFPSESANCVIATKNPEKYDAQLLAVKRAFISDSNQPYAGLDSIMSDINKQQLPLPKQVIHCGKYQLKEQINQHLLEVFPSAAHCNLDTLIGYTGPAAAMHAVSLAVAMIKQQKSIDTVFCDKAILPNSVETALVITYGSQGQICYLLIGAKHD